MKLFYVICWFLPVLIHARRNQTKRGLSFSSRIVGGSKVETGSAPWFARAISSSGKWRGCGGFLIAPEFVLTAAHCSSAVRTGFQIGALCKPYGPLPENNCHQYVETRWTKQVFVHPDYGPVWLDYDFALVQLQQPSTIDPVKIDEGDISTSYTGGELLTPIGFGRTSASGPVTTDLMHVNVSYVTDSECDRIFYRNIPDDQMCAGDEVNPRDSCAGDSGGPLYDQASGAVVGITSWGYGCGGVLPAGYSRIADQFEWIKAIVCEYHTRESAPSFCNFDPISTPTATPSGNPSLQPSGQPTKTQSEPPSGKPSLIPTGLPSYDPSIYHHPSTTPSFTPRKFPSAIPSPLPSSNPSSTPSTLPSVTPTDLPTLIPSIILTGSPSSLPTVTPTETPICSDDTTWYYYNGKHSKHCGHVYFSPSKHCSKLSAEGVPASEACPIACGDLRTKSCDIPNCGDDSWFHWFRNKKSKSCYDYLYRRGSFRGRGRCMSLGVTALSNDPKFFAYEYCSRCKACVP